MKPKPSDDCIYKPNMATIRSPTRQSYQKMMTYPKNRWTEWIWRSLHNLKMGCRKMKMKMQKSPNSPKPAHLRLHLHRLHHQCRNRRNQPLLLDQHRPRLSFLQNLRMMMTYLLKKMLCLANLNQCRPDQLLPNPRRRQWPVDHRHQSPARSLKKMMTASTRKTVITRTPAWIWLM